MDELQGKTMGRIQGAKTKDAEGAELWVESVICRDEPVFGERTEGQEDLF